MPIVTYNGDSFNCTKAVKGANYIDLYNNGVLIVKFGGVVDFSKFTISDGSWSAPAGVEEVRGTATLTDGRLKIDLDSYCEIGDATVVKFKAPCGCTAVSTGVIIGNDEYTLVDANGGSLAGSAAWTAGAQVSLQLDITAKKAFVLNAAVSDTYTRSQIMSDETKATLGFEADAVPDTAIKSIGANMWAICTWEEPNEVRVSEENFKLTNVDTQGAARGSWTIYDNVEILPCIDGGVMLNRAVADSITLLNDFDSEVLAERLRGKYFGIYSREGSDDPLYFMPSDANFDNLSGAGGWYLNASTVQVVSIEGGVVKVDRILHSAASDAYTPGVRDGKYIEYLGATHRLLYGAVTESPVELSTMAAAILEGVNDV